MRIARIASFGLLGFSLLHGATVWAGGYQNGWCNGVGNPHHSLGCAAGGVSVGITDSPGAPEAIIPVPTGQTGTPPVIRVPGAQPQATPMLVPQQVPQPTLVAVPPLAPGLVAVPPQPQATPMLVPQQVPQPTPVAVPPLAPGLVAVPPQPQATPMLVPQQVPQPTPVAVPPLAPGLVAVPPQPQATPMLVPQQVPQPTPVATPPLVPGLRPTEVSRPVPSRRPVRIPVAVVGGQTPPSTTSGQTGTALVVPRPGRQPAHELPVRELEARPGGVTCLASGFGWRKVADTSGKVEHVGLAPILRTPDMLLHDLPANHPRHADCLVRVVRRLEDRAKPR